MALSLKQGNISNPNKRKRNGPSEKSGSESSLKSDCNIKIEEKFIKQEA